MRYYGPDTVSQGPTVPLARTTFGATRIGSIVANPDGTSHVFFQGWYKEDYDLWWVQRLRASGKPLGAPIKIGTGWRGDYNQAVRLAGGNMMTVWVGESAPVAKVVTDDGKIAATNDGGVCDGYLEDIAALPNGGAVVSYYGSNLLASFQLLTPAARRTGKAISVPSLYSAGGMTLASHPRGFVGLWKNVDASDAPILEGAIYSATGAKLVTLGTVKLRPTGAEDRYKDFFGVALSLADGRVIAAYDSIPPPEPGHQRPHLRDHRGPLRRHR